MHDYSTDKQLHRPRLQIWRIDTKNKKFGELSAEKLQVSEIQWRKWQLWQWKNLWLRVLPGVLCNKSVSGGIPFVRVLDKTTSLVLNINKLELKESISSGVQLPQSKQKAGKIIRL